MFRHQIQQRSEGKRESKRKGIKPIKLKKFLDYFSAAINLNMHYSNSYYEHFSCDVDD